MTIMETPWLDLLLYWLVSGIALLITSKIVRGFNVSGFFTACIAALVIGIANAILWKILLILTFPLTILTMGLFIFVLNGAILKIAAMFVKGFEIDSWMAAIVGSIVFSLLSWLLHYCLT